MSLARRHHAKKMAVLRRAQSSPDDALPASPPVESSVEDTIATLTYEPIAATNLHASHIPVQQPTPSIDIPTSRTHMSDRELAFAITTALLGTGALLLLAAVAHLLWRRGGGQLTTSADTQEQGLRVPKELDDSTWGPQMQDKCRGFQEYPAESPCLPTLDPSFFNPCISDPNVSPPQTSVQTLGTELTAILEQFEQRLLQEEKDIALALDIAFGHDTPHCAPFFAGSEDDVTTMLSLQAGLESVGKRATGIRNRARQGSDASASSQSTTVTIEAFPSQSSSNSSLTSMESMMSDIDESGEEAEEEVVYEVKRAQTHSMEIQKGKLIAWQPGGMGLMVTGPSTTTLATASSSVSVNLDEFPVPP
ncbi:hypothetical protein MSAN_00021000 [Mycena sanguinolenta]|uniref:Uncharacterized protein n=1 Tax=Mycena sanguinolenta TaxID=230812 RepID=A0A8H7DJW5_9AGAR|nr:hypothetical protein MSAN_00021000 [Mycena sanguinolenta]